MIKTTNTMKQILLAICICFAMLHTNAQGKKGEKIRAIRVAMLTDALNLDEASATKFWPMYNTYDDAHKAIRQEKKELMEQLEKTSSMSDAEIIKCLNGVTNCHQKEVDLQKKYTTEFLKVISAKQLAALFQAEKNFKELLVSKMKGDMQDIQQRGLRRFGRNR
jgi:Spy/CpxP family protein refolding chaperone